MCVVPMWGLGRKVQSEMWGPFCWLWAVSNLKWLFAIQEEERDPVGLRSDDRCYKGTKNTSTQISPGGP